jgi:ubiquinone biosynthesis protein UbiJ
VNRLDPTFGVAALGALETALNAALALDPDTLRRLADLDGKVIALELQQPSFTLYLAPHAKGLRLMAYFDGAADTTLTGTPAGFLKLARSTPGSGLFTGEVSIRGDVELGRRFQHIFNTLDFDWEEHLAHLTGDVIAHQTGNLLRGFGAWVQQAGESLRRSSGDYLKEESGILPTRPEVEAFARAVEALRSDADRLEARIKHLRRRLND